jgi:endonuclease YncB( thermonuclease family)
MHRSIALILALAFAAPASAQTARVVRAHPVNDGDTIFVRMGGKERTIRFLGVQAFELSVYNNANPSKWRGECHSVQAARFVLKTVKRTGYRVRLSSSAPWTDERGRLVRTVEVREGGRWRDLSAMLLSRGLVLWLHHIKDKDLNERYNRLEQQAAARGAGLWSGDDCGAGPSQEAALQLRVFSDPLGEDTDVNDEWVRVTNTGATAVPLGGWYLGNAGPKSERFPFPAGTTIGPGESLTVHTGNGTGGGGRFYRGIGHTIFENSYNGFGAGDAAYLVDPDGDVRAHMIYPCLFRCTDPRTGDVQVTANAVRGPERVDIRNISDTPIDLFGYQLRVKGNYAFDRDSVLAPGETMSVFIKGDPSEDTRLEKHIGYPGAYMRDAGGTARVSTFDEIDLACDFWGDGDCASRGRSV